MRVQVAVLVVGLIHATTCAVPAAAQGPGVDGSRKYAVMAAFLYNFLLYVEWPESGGLAEGPVRIGILGPSPFGDAIWTIRKKTVQGRPIEIQVFEEAVGIEPTHILFITRSHTDQTEEACRAAREQAVLTVGETEDFTRRGGVIRFFLEAPDAKNISLEINRTAADASRLKIRSKLWRLATVVDYPMPAAQITETTP